MNIITKEEAMEKFHSEKDLRKFLIGVCKRRCSEFIQGEKCKQVYILLLTPDKTKFLMASETMDNITELGNEEDSVYLPSLGAKLIRAIQEGVELEFEGESLFVDNTYHILAIGFTAVGMALKYQKDEETGELTEGSEEKIEGQIFSIDFSFGKFFCVFEIPKEFVEEFVEDPTMEAFALDNPDAKDIPEMEGRYNSLLTQSMNIYETQEEVMGLITKNPYPSNLNNSNNSFARIQEEIDKLETP